mgnify:FL=1
MAQVQIIQPYQPRSDTLEKVAAYCRVSTDSQDQLNSYRTQIGYYTNFIAQHPGWELADIYADKGISGTSLEKRDEFKRMLQDCRAGKITRILVKSVSRFARNTLELIETTRELKDLGVVVVFEEQGIDTAQMLGEMQLTLLAMAAQEESISISKNMRLSYQKRMEYGKYVTTKAPYGYAYADGKLTPKPEEASVVQTIFHLFLEGKGQQQIADLLNQSGVIPRESSKWGRTTIEHILSNERYIGDALVQKRFNTETLPHKQVINRGQLPQYYITDSHPPLISCEIFQQAQMLKAMRADSKRPSPHTFIHRIQCPSCGRYYRHINSSGTSKWACPNRVNKVKDCPNYWISEMSIKSSFINLLGKLYLHRDTLLSPTLYLLEEIAARQEQGNAKLYELNTALADLNEKAHTLHRLHNKGFIEDADFREQSDALVSQRKKLADQRTQAIHGSKALEALDKLRELQELSEALPEIPWEFDIGLFDQLVEKIVPISKTELLFKLKCGLELKEAIRQ